MNEQFPGLGQYVYFNTLFETNPPFGAKAASYVTFNGVTNSDPINDENHDFILAINTATNMLRKIAISEAAKEQAAIQNFINLIDKKLSDKSLPDKIKSTLPELKQKITSTDIKAANSAELKLIQQISIMKNGLENYERRLAEINEVNMSDTKNIDNDKVKERYEYRIQGDIENYLKHLGNRQHKSDARERDLRLHDFLSSLISKKLPNFQADLKLSIETALYADFSLWIENNTDTTYPQINPNDLLNYLEKYLNPYDDKQLRGRTRLLNMIEQNNKELTYVANEMSKGLGSKYIDKDTYKELKVTYDKIKDTDQKKVQINNLTYTKRQIKDMISTYERNINTDLDKRFTFQFNSKLGSSHGNFYETLLAALTNAINVKANAGADLIIPLGTAVLSKSPTKQDNELIKLAHNIENIISKDFNENKDMDLKNFQALIEDQRTMSKNIKEQINETQKSLNSNGLNDFQDFFITHDSLKLYQSTESGTQKVKGFHGRSMNILSALSKLYASPELSAAMINSDMLITYLINIDSETVTYGANKQPLETYLSLFAGMLMFDDIVSMVEDISVNMDIPSYANVKQLHVYNLGGTYFPLSVILNNIISQVENVSINLAFDPSNTAVAKISGPSLSSPKKDDPTTWSTIASSTISGTKIQIHFLTGFLNYISQLFNAFNSQA